MLLSTLFTNKQTIMIISLIIIWTIIGPIQTTILAYIITMILIIIGIHITHICMYMYMYMCVYIYIYIRMYVSCIRTYIYIYTHMYIHSSCGRRARFSCSIMPRNSAAIPASNLYIYIYIYVLFVFCCLLSDFIYFSNSHNNKYAIMFYV